MATFGSISQFDATVEPWAQYTEHLEQFFVANNIADENKKRAIFLTVVGPSTYGLLKNLISPQLPTEQTLQQLVTVLNNHFDPAPSEIVERFKFNSRVRRAGESVSTYIAELRRLAKHCAFGTSLDMMLRDRIVCGIQDESIQRKLLAEPRLTLLRATEMAVSMETAARNAVDLKATPSSSSEEVLFVKQTARNFRQQTKAAPAAVKNSDANLKCFRCGNTDHRSADCRFIDATCHSCGKTGHLSRICQSKNVNRVPGRRRGSGKVNQVQEYPETDTPLSVEASEQYMLFNLTALGEAPPPARVTCWVEGHAIQMEVDSGAPFALISSGTYNKLKGSFPPLLKTDIKLQSYTKHPIDILGVVNVRVSYQSKEMQLPLLVVKQGTTNLAGRNWILPLSLMSAFGITDSVTAYQSASPGSDSLSPLVTAPRISLQDILSKHKQVFAPDLGLIKGVKVHLTLRSAATPRFFKARPVPYALREKVDRELDRLLEEGILVPVKTSEWAAPVVPVLKRDGTVRLCGDFKLTVNPATELEKYPLPKIEDLFAQLSGGESFSKLDLRDAYCQLELDEESQKLVVINTQRGLFRYTRLPFGVASSPSIFQREMDKILQGQRGATCYLDDLLVTGSDSTTHLETLDQVLSKLEKAGVRLHSTKSEFQKSSVEYLGHRIDKDGLHPVDSKLDAIDKAPSPTNVDELRSFLGLLTYYSKFLPHMATLLAPLYKLLERKQSWRWTAKEEQVFCKAKHTLKTSSLLVHFDNKKEVILACDASPYGVGAVLSHKTAGGDRPIAFASRALTKAERNYSHIEKETLALVFGVTRFRNYLLGREFTLLTDHRPLVSLLSETKPVPTVAAARIQRWALTLAAYAYKIQFRKGSSHANADACSRLPLPTKDAEPPLPAELVLLLEPLDDSPVTAYHIRSHIDADPVLCTVRSHILHGWPKVVPPDLHAFWLCRLELSVVNNIILRGSRIFIPAKFRQFILHELHDGHQGVSVIKAMARSSVWWPGIDQEIETLVRQCIPCQEHSSMPPARHVPWPVPKGPWERIHIDHAGPVENHILLVVVDANTKWLEVLPVPSTSSPATIAALRGVFARFGLPKSLVSDNGTAFSSAEFRSFVVQNGITHIRTAPYHPNSNGLAERAVRTVKTALKKISAGTFQERLERFLFNYRRAPLAASGVSPAVAMLGRPLRSRLDLVHPDSLKPSPSPGPAASFQKGDEVWARNFGRGPDWVPGSVTGPVGRVMLEVKTPSGTWFRHLDQVRRGAGTSQMPDDSRENLPSGSSDEEQVAPGAVPNESGLAAYGLAQSPEGTTTVPRETVEPSKSPSTPVLRRSSRTSRAPERLNL